MCIDAHVGAVGASTSACAAAALLFCVRMYVCVCMCIDAHVGVECVLSYGACMHLCMHACVCVCVYVCMYVWTYGTRRDNWVAGF